jgi:hypothetical protein
MTHQHWFTALWWHFGPYGPQDVHVHSCLYETPGTGDHDCHRVLIGAGFDCDGAPNSHERKTLTAAGPVARARRGVSTDDA